MTDLAGTPPEPDAITPVIDASDVVFRALQPLFDAERICGDWRPTLVRDAQPASCSLLLCREDRGIVFGKLMVASREGLVLADTVVGPKLEQVGVAEPFSAARWLSFITGIEQALWGLGFIVLQVESLTG